MQQVEGDVTISIINEAVKNPNDGLLAQYFIDLINQGYIFEPDLKTHQLFIYLSSETVGVADLNSKTFIDGPAPEGLEKMTNSESSYFTFLCNILGY